MRRMTTLPRLRLPRSEGFDNVRPGYNRGSHSGAESHSGQPSPRSLAEALGRSRRGAGGGARAALGAFRTDAGRRAAPLRSLRAIPRHSSPWRRPPEGSQSPDPQRQGRTAAIPAPGFPLRAGLKKRRSFHGSPPSVASNPAMSSGPLRPSSSTSKAISCDRRSSVPCHWTKRTCGLSPPVSTLSKTSSSPGAIGAPLNHSANWRSSRSSPAWRRRIVSSAYPGQHCHVGQE